MEAQAKNVLWFQSGISADDAAALFTKDGLARINEDTTQYDPYARRALDNLEVFTDRWYPYFKSEIESVKSSIKSSKKRKQMQDAIDKFEQTLENWYIGIKDQMIPDLQRLSEPGVILLKLTEQYRGVIKVGFYSMLCDLQNLRDRTEGKAIKDEYATFCQNLSGDTPGGMLKLDINAKPPQAKPLKVADDSIEVLGLTLPAKKEGESSGPPGKVIIIAMVAAVVVVLVIVLVMFVFKGSPGTGPVPERFAGGVVRMNEQGRRVYTEQMHHNELDGAAGFDVIDIGRSVGMDMPGMMIAQNEENKQEVARVVAKQHQEDRSLGKNSGGESASETRGRDDAQMQTLTGAQGRMDGSHGAREHFADCPCGCNSLHA